jgi:hypothetical protein
MRPSNRLFLCVLLFLVYGSVIAQVNLTVINSPYHQTFDTLLSSGTGNDIGTLPAGWTFLEIGINANTTYAASTGSSNAGNTYSFGLNNERALGGLQSGSLIPVVGSSFLNNTGATITSLQFSYRGEQWRLGTTGRVDRLDFQYSFNATSLSSETWTDYDALDFQSPVTSGTVGALNGNDTINNNVITAEISGLNIEPGAVFFIRWTDFNATGADDGLAVDDFELIPVGIDPHLPSISFVPAFLNFGEINIHSADTLTYQVIGANLTDSIRATTYSSSYQISIDGIHFYANVTLPHSGGVVYVRFAPTVDGLLIDSVLHENVNTNKTLKVIGKGFDQAANIISIAAARSKPVGERVTIAGRVTVGNEFANPAYIQDSTGGIPVFDFSFANAVSIGDSVILTGPVGVFNNQKQISGSGIFYTILPADSISITPKIIPLHELAAHEGELVTVKNISLINDEFVFYPQSTELITNDSITADLRIDGDTGIPGLSKPNGLFDVTGVVGRFRTNVQLMPRFHDDIPAATVPATPTDSIPKSKTLDIVNWNLEFFGARSEDYGNEEFGPEDESLQLINVRRVLDSLRADIIAVQEVSDDSAFFYMVAALGHYKASCSDRYSYSFEGPSDEFPPQKVCFIYDTTTVSNVGARVLFEDLYDSARTIDPSALPGYPGGSGASFFSSGRLPYLLTATVTIDHVETDLALINVHAKSGASVEDRNRRAYDAGVLKDSLDATFAGRKFIFLGDFNDDLDQSIAAGQPSSYDNFVQDSAQYFAATKALSHAGARSTVSFNDVIDHQILSDPLHAEYLPGSATVITPFNLISNYANTTSDHLPVITRYSLRAPVISFIKNSYLVSEDSSAITIEVSLDKPLSRDITVPVLISGDAIYASDFTTLPNAESNVVALTIPANLTHTSFSLQVIDDPLDETEEQVHFLIRDIPGIATGIFDEVVVRIFDNDIPSIDFDKILTVAQEGEGDQVMKLKLTTPVASQQNITIQVLNGSGVNYPSDYSSTPLISSNKIQLIIPAGSNETAVVLNPKVDTRRELPELVTFYLSEGSSGLKIGPSRIALFTILDGRRTTLQFSFAPNPTVSFSKLVCPEIGDTEKLSVELRSGQGEIVFRGTGTISQLNDRLSGKIQSLRTGIYLVNVIYEGDSYNIRLSKQ